MPNTTNPRDGLIEEAVFLARDVAPRLHSILITHYSDADTLDTLRPGETDLDFVTALNRAVGEEFAALGVSVFVQRADRAAFRRWMQGRADTAENRLSWVDRGRLLRGPDALTVLGAGPIQGPSRPVLGHVPGPIADRVVESYSDEDDADFLELARTLIAAGRDDALELAIRKASDQLGEDSAADMSFAFREIAEAAEAGPSGWAELVALPMALVVGSVPDAAELGASLISSGALPDTVEIRFLPGWRSPDALAGLHATAVRRVLLDLVAGVEPHDIPPGDTDDLAKSGFGVLLGLQIDWDIPVWDDVYFNGLPQEPEEGEGASEDEERATAFQRWRMSAAEASGGCVPLGLVPPSKVQDEISSFMDEAEEHARPVEEIRDFVAMIRREANDEEVVCRLEVIRSAFIISLYTRAGRFLDSLTLSAERLPVSAEGMASLIETLVPVVRAAPGASN
jgi:hypothetical protein